MLSAATLQYGEALTPALLGVDALYRAEEDNGDDAGLVVLNMSATHRPEVYASYATAEARFADLERAAEDLPEADRQLYYGQVCRSTLAFMRWRAGKLAFTEQVSQFLHVLAAPASDHELDGLRGEMRTLLTHMGYSGDLATQCSAWEERNRVRPEEVPAVLAELLDEAWERTVERMELPAPKSDGMQVKTVSGVPFNARCDYLHRQVELNIDPILTRPALKHLAVHECYPGHYVQFKLRETWYQEGSAAADGLLSVVNTASSSTFEGIADNGLYLLDWIESDDDRVSALMTRYRSGIGTGAAWRLHAEGWSPERVTDWLHGQSLVGGEGWVHNRMRFIAAPQRSALIWSYWWGEASVTPVWRALAPPQRPAFLRFLYGRMHSPQSVALFA
ncbi:MAG: hypothetical protein H0X37_04840 [Herpetosiphonaceae bacterium]|nr:hypothetical protein [Herpetosiphonaceae bacterium]